MLRKGVIPIPPARNTAGLNEFLWSVKDPIGESIFISVPRGIFFSERLNAVSRMRVVNIKWFSNGELAIEKVRVFPSASVSGALASVRFGGLSRFEIELRGFFEMEGHGAFRNLDLAQQSGSVTGDRNFFNSHVIPSTFG
jgi:hypothetical protein